MPHIQKIYPEIIIYKNNSNALVFIRFKNSLYGGAERYLARVIDQLKNNKVPCRTFHSDLPSWLPSWLKVLLFSYRVCIFKKKLQQNNPKARPILFSLDRITCPDIYRAGDGVHRAFLQSMGLSLNPLHLSYLWLERRTFENAKLIIANSQMVKSQILEHYPQIDEHKIVVIYNGVPIPEHIDEKGTKAQLAEEFNFDPSRPILLYVGSGFRRKGVAEFLRILARMQTKATAFIIGKEKHMRFYRRLAQELGIEDRVYFTGPRRDVEHFYAAADLFLFPTRYEPFSNVVLEALSYATPAFTTRQNGAHEILDSFYVMETPTDPGIVRKIDALLADPARLAAAKSQARELARAYPIERNVEETLEVIRRTERLLSES